MSVCYLIVFVCCYLLCTCELFILYNVFLLILNAIISYCLDLIAYCNPVLITPSSISSLVSTDSGSVNVNVCVYVCM
jgi:ABC-type multidrug transport system permease subunit